jgi:hypothetical protein
MFTVTSKVGKTNHVFTSETEFLYQEDWILENKGKEVYDAWKLRDKTDEAMLHPDSITLYEEWLDFYGITHTQTHDE